jgi:hypothetical protein
LGQGIPLPRYLVDTFNELAASYHLEERLRPRSVKRTVRSSRGRDGAQKHSVPKGGVGQKRS